MLAFGALLLSAVCSGTATILQAGVARRLPTVDRLDAGLLIRLLRRSAYLGALASSSSGCSLRCTRCAPCRSTWSKRSGRRASG